MGPLPPELLKAELLDLEQQLRALVPQAPQTSREQLLYQAGWEAALAHAANTTPTVATVTPALTVAAVPPASVGNRRRTAWYWPASMAALLLLCATLGWRVWEQRGVTSVDSAPLTTVPTMSGPIATAPVVIAPSAAVPQLSNAALPRIESPPAYGVPSPATYTARQETRDQTDYRALANYLELRDRIARGGLSMLPTPVGRGEEQPRAAKSSQRELLAELWREVL